MERLFSVSVLFLCFFLAGGNAGNNLQTAGKKIRKGISEGARASVTRGVTAAMAANSAEAARMLLRCVSGPPEIPSNRRDLYWIILYGASAMPDAGAAQEMGKHVALNQNKPIAPHLMTVLSQHSHSGVARAMKLIHQGTRGDLKTLAAKHLPRMGMVKPTADPAPSNDKPEPAAGKDCR